MQKRHKIMLSVLLLAAIVAAFWLAPKSPKVKYGENLLLNPSFDEVDEETGLPLFWMTGAYVQAQNVTSYQGIGSYAQIQNHGLNDARFFQRVNVAPNTLYCLEGLIKADSFGGRGANLSIEGLSVYTESVYQSDGFQKVSLWGKTGPEQTMLTVYARLGGYSGEAEGWAQFDDVKFYPVKEAPKGVAVHLLYDASDYIKDEKEPASAWWKLLAVGLLYVGFAFAVLKNIKKESPILKEKYNRYLLPALLLLALSVRVLVLIFVRGYPVDVGCFTSWASSMATYGSKQFYASAGFSDYPPGYLLFLWPFGILGQQLFGGVTEAIIKIPPILFDLGTVWVLFGMGKKHANVRLAFIVSLLYALHPAGILIGAGWGQIDSALAFFALVTVDNAIENKWHLALPAFMLGVLFKPQMLMFGPLGLVALIACIIHRKKDAPWKEIIIGIVSALMIGVFVVWLFSPDGKLTWIFDLYFNTMGYYDRATVNATNFYFLFGQNWGMLDTVMPYLMKVTGLLSFLVPFAVFDGLYYKNKKRNIVCAAVLLSALLISLIPMQVSLFGPLMMGASFFVILFLYIKGKDVRLLPLMSAVLLCAFFAFGTMMHERYLFPALALLAVSLYFYRDKRLFILFLMVGLVVFFNSGIVLDRALRIGGVEGHLHAPSFDIISDSPLFEYLISALSVVTASYSFYVARAMMEEERQPLEVSLKEKSDNYLEEAFYNPLKPVKIEKREAIWVWLATLIYTLFALTNLGSHKAPENAWVSEALGESAMIDLGESRSFNILYDVGIHYGSNSFLVSASESEEEGGNYDEVTVSPGDCFAWRFVKKDNQNIIYTGRHVHLTAQSIGLTVYELIFRDIETGENIVPVSSTVPALVDEQDALENEPLWFSPKRPAQPSWYNSMYFDEIYHARTGLEQLNALTGRQPSSIYETTHPPLGKVFMTLSIALFGMNPFAWRLPGALAGAFMLPGMYYMGHYLFKNKRFGWLAFTLMALDGMHFAQTRIATIDSFVTLFIIWAYLYMYRYFLQDDFEPDTKKTFKPLLLSGIFMGLACASKWTGCYAGLGLAVIFFWKQGRMVRTSLSIKNTDDESNPRIKTLNTLSTRQLDTFFACVVFFVIIPLAIYILSYIPVYAAEGGVTLKKVWNSAQHMLSYHGKPGLGMDHPYYSPWYKWPINQKPMWYYSSQRFDGTGSTIFAVGNPVVWYSGLLGLLFMVIHLIVLKVTRQKDTVQVGDFGLGMLLFVSFLAQYLPWALVPRGTYIYHYFPSVPFIILCACYGLFVLSKYKEKPATIISRTLILLSFVVFIFLFPYVSGLRMPTWFLDIAKVIPGIWY